MGKECEVSNSFLNQLDKDKLDYLNSKYILQCRAQVATTQEFFKKIDLDHRGVQPTPDLNFFSPENELFTSVMKYNTRVDNISSVVLAIEGQCIIYNRISVS